MNWISLYQHLHKTLVIIVILEEMLLQDFDMFMNMAVHVREMNANTKKIRFLLGLAPQKIEIQHLRFSFVLSTGRIIHRTVILTDLKEN